MDVRSLIALVAMLVMLWLLRLWLRRNTLTRASFNRNQLRSKLTTPPLPARNRRQPSPVSDGPVADSPEEQLIGGELEQALRQTIRDRDEEIALLRQTLADSTEQRGAGSAEDRHADSSVSSLSSSSASSAARASEISPDDDAQLHIRLASLESQLDDKDQQLRRQEHAFQELEKLKKQLFERTREIDILQQSKLKTEETLEHFRDGAQKAAMLEQQLAASSTQAGTVESREATIARLTQALEQAEAEAGKAQQNDLELRRLRGEVGSLQANNALSASRVKDLERRLSEQRVRLSKEGLATSDLSLRDSDVADTPDQLASGQPPRRQPLFAAPDQVDDLKLIKGIGPAMERTLNELGVMSFKQLSQLNQDDVDKVSEAIGAFPGRIERDNWIGQASSLLGDLNTAIEKTD